MRALDETHRQQLLAAFAAVRKGGSAATIVQNAQQSATPQGGRRAARAAAGAIDAERTAEREAAVLEAQAKIDDLLLKQEAAVRRRDERKRLKDEAEAAVRNARLPGAATRDPKRVQKLEAAVAERKAKFLVAERELRIQMHKVADAEADLRAEEEGAEPAYMKGRQTFKDPLEDYLGALPFESFEIEAGSEGTRGSTSRR